MDDKALRENQNKTRAAFELFLRGALGFRETKRRKTTDVDGR
jgi:hypothetical protein